MQDAKRQAFGTPTPHGRTIGVCDDVVYRDSFLKIWHTYKERCCGKKQTNKKTAGFTPTALLFIALDGTEIIPERSHKGRGFEQLSTFHPKMNLQLTLWTIGKCDSCLEINKIKNWNKSNKYKQLQCNLHPGFVVPAIFTTGPLVYL